MSGINAYIIQQRLKKESAISVPWIQMEYQLSYAEAKRLLERLKAQGWIQETPTGIQYAVRHENLKLRKITRNEVDTLIRKITKDHVAVLATVVKDGSIRLSQIYIRRMVLDEVIKALEELIDYKLIFKRGEFYCTRISRKVYGALTCVAQIKEYRGLERAELSDMVMEDLRAQFKPLFEE